MASSNLPSLPLTLTTPQADMWMYSVISPFGAASDRKISANSLLATITAAISDISLQFDNGLGTATVSAAGKAKIRYNDTLKVFQFSADGAAYASFGTPASPSTSVQFNNAGAFGGSANFTWVNASNRLVLGAAASATGQLQFAVSGSANTQTFQAADTPTSALTFKWPAADPTAGQTLSFSAPAAGVVTLTYQSAGSGTVNAGTQFQMAYYATSAAAVSGLANLVTDANGDLSHAASPRTGTQTFYNRIITPADTALTASTESVGIQFGGDTSAATVIRQFSTGALTTQEEYKFIPPTYAFVGASTITNAPTVSIASPIAGANATLTNPVALYLKQSTAAHFGIMGDDGTNTAFARVAGDTNTEGAWNFSANRSGSNQFYVKNTNTGGGNYLIVTKPNGGARFFFGWDPFGTSPDKTTIASEGNHHISFQATIGTINFTANYLLAGSIVIGSGGNGVTAASPGTGTIMGVGGSGSNVAGATLNIYSGIGTGTGVPGNIGLQFARPATSGSSLNTQQDQFLLSYSTDALSITAQLKSSTTANRDAGKQLALWTDNTDASRTSALSLQSVVNAGSLIDRYIIGASKVLTNNTVTTVQNVTVASNTVASGIVDYAVEVFDGTDVQVETGSFIYQITNKGGALANNTITQPTGYPKNATTSGTLTVTWTITAANPALLRVNANSSLTPSAGFPRVTYTLRNLTSQAVAIQ